MSIEDQPKILTRHDWDKVNAELVKAQTQIAAMKKLMLKADEILGGLTTRRGDDYITKEERTIRDARFFLIEVEDHEYDEVVKEYGL